MKKRILALSLVPLLGMSFIIMLLVMTFVQAKTQKDTETTLKGVAVALSAAYGQNSGDYIETEDGEVWKGAYNISKSGDLVDSIKENSGVEVTFCYGKRRIISSAKDGEGNRIIGSEVGDVIAQKVLTDKETVFSDNILIEDTEYYGYYMPVYQNGSDEVIGIIFAGMPLKAGKETYYSILKIVLLVTIVFLIWNLVVNDFAARAMAKAIGAAGSAAKAVAAGDLTTEIPSRYLHRSDEIGDVCRSLDGMKNELRYIIEDMNKNTQKLLDSAEYLDGNAQNTLVTVGSVDKAVNDIAEGAGSQAKDAIHATENVTLMGNMLVANGKEIENLQANARNMQAYSEQATRSLAELMQVNQNVMDAMEKIYEQTNRTNLSSQKIREATNIISDISEETNLLSLNASIEAARAGEQGRGFAVVANEIQHLAEQSGSSTDAIASMVNELIQDSDRAVLIMEQAREIILSQSKNVAQTQNVVVEVIRAIESSIEAIASIEQQSVKINEAKDEIVNVVENLSAVAEENAASTEETSAATAEVANSFNEVTEAAETLKNIADSIAETLGTFQI